MVIPTITHGGGRGATTDLVAGDRHGVTDTEGTPAPMFMAGGAIRLTSILRLHGRTPTLETTARETALCFRIRSAGLLESRDGEQTRIFIPGTPSVGAGPRSTIRRLESLPAVALDTPATSTPGKEWPAAAGLLTTRTPAQESPQAEITFMPERMARSIVTTGKAETGQRITATDGNLQAGHSRTFSSSNTHDQLVNNELKTSAARGHEVSGQADDARRMMQL